MSYSQHRSRDFRDCAMSSAVGSLLSAPLQSVIDTQPDDLPIENRLDIRLGVLGRYFAPLLSVQIKPRLDFNPKELSPINKIAKIKAPVFIIAGGKDQHTRLKESKQFYELAPEPKALWILPNAAHVDLQKYSPAEYEQRVLQFLSDHLSKKSV